MKKIRLSDSFLRQRFGRSMIIFHSNTRWGGCSSTSWAANVVAKDTYVEWWRLGIEVQWERLFCSHWAMCLSSEGMNTDSDWTTTERLKTEMVNVQRSTFKFRPSDVTLLTNSPSILVGYPTSLLLTIVVIILLVISLFLSTKTKQNYIKEYIFGAVTIVEIFRVSSKL